MGRNLPDAISNSNQAENRMVGSEIFGNKTYDIFVTHAWRYHEDWTRLSTMLDNEEGLKWRNFSVPWYDPALDPNTEIGSRHVREWLEGQIRPVVGVVLLDSVYAVKSARKWLDLEVELARKLDKTVLGLPTFGQCDMSDEATAIVDRIVEWNGESIVGSLKELTDK